MPPPLEQDIIAEFLDRETLKIDALISAAVTGKIDVRAG